MDVLKISTSTQEAKKMRNEGRKQVTKMADISLNI